MLNKYFSKKSSILVSPLDLRKKKILFLIPSKYIGGAELRGLWIASEFKRLGADVYMMFKNYSDLLQLIVLLKKFGINYINVDIIDEKRKTLISICKNLVIVIRILYSVKKYKPNYIVINVPQINCSLWAILACAMTFKRTIVRFALLEENDELNKIKKFLLYISKIVNQEWVALTENNRNILSNLTGIKKEKIHLINNAFSEKIRESLILKKEKNKVPKIPINYNFIVAVGEITKRKGFDLFIEASEIVINKYKNTFFLWAGNGDQQNISKFEEIVKIHNLKNKVITSGWINDIGELLKIADMIVVPSRNEGYPNIILEAFFYKCPVISFKTGSITELVNDGYTGLLAEKENFRSLAEKIIFGIENKKLLKEYALNAKNKITRYSNEIMIEKYSKLLIK